MKASDQFSDEEKEHLNYLGSMLHQEPTEEEEAAQERLEALEKAGWFKKFNAGSDRRD